MITYVTDHWIALAIIAVFLAVIAYELWVAWWLGRAPRTAWDDYCESIDRELDEVLALANTRPHGGVGESWRN